MKYGSTTLEITIYLYDINWNYKVLLSVAQKIATLITTRRRYT